MRMCACAFTRVCQLVCVPEHRLDCSVLGRTAVDELRQHTIPCPRCPHTSLARAQRFAVEPRLKRGSFEQREGVDVRRLRTEFEKAGDH
eukprot:6100517-Prymnesium_polylepis.2